MTRPSLTTNLTSEEFKEYYFLKEELKDFLRSEGLKVSGGKSELEKRIIYYLDTGEELKEKNEIVDVKDSSEEITLESEIGENFKCSEDKRKFFEKEIGKSFKFKVKFQKWLKANPTKTYQDAINAYYEIQNSKEKTAIGKQFEYNQYIRDFFENNDDKSLDDAIACWKYKKSLKGHNKYEKKDLEILN
ncbi:MAG: hypothetical protein IJL02_12390 [Methanobrevibacter sp.]|uniref:DUF6434 domain-containing protein n=1 Tax=Methanobrevibacter sp. TaxID=66852 RepID=UPI0025CBA8C2|nr:DUF6434 domain-containing protein [Methanobrevibacter sp.]MBQ6099554.1 hypothetical protein [Methanobrevibacter sp.]MBQ6100646.1 hypothetical protein [Methanobrevibacter sp.]